MPAGRSIVTLLRDQAEEVRRHRLRFLSPKQLRTAAYRPVRLPSVDASALPSEGPSAGGPPGPLPLSHLPRPPTAQHSPRRLPAIMRSSPSAQCRAFSHPPPPRPSRAQGGRRSASPPAPASASPDGCLEFDPIVLAPAEPSPEPSTSKPPAPTALPSGPEPVVGSPVQLRRRSRRSAVGEPPFLGPLREFQPPMELGPLGWQAHRLVVTLLAVHASQSLGLTGLAVEAELDGLEALAAEYYQALLWVVNITGYDLHFPAPMARWPACTARLGLPATLELARTLGQHLKELAGLADHLLTWCGQAPLSLLDHLDPSLGTLHAALRSSDVPRALAAAERLPAPPGAEGDAVGALRMEVRRQCLAPTAPQPCPPVMACLFQTLRSYLVVRTVLTGATAVPHFPSHASLQSSELPALRGY